MKVFEGHPSTWNAGGEPHAVAIGVFDGVHRGHRAVFGGLAEASGDQPLVAMTFSTHPDAVVTGHPAPPALTTLERRLEQFDDVGLYGAAIIDFDADFMRLAPDQFVAEYLVDGLAASLVAVGAGFRFGHQASGTVDTLRPVSYTHLRAHETS